MSQQTRSAMRGVGAGDCRPVPRSSSSERGFLSGKHQQQQVEEARNVACTHSDGTLLTNGTRSGANRSFDPHQLKVNQMGSSSSSHQSSSDGLRKTTSAFQFIHGRPCDASAERRHSSRDTWYAPRQAAQQQQQVQKTVDFSAMGEVCRNAAVLTSASPPTPPSPSSTSSQQTKSGTSSPFLDFISSSNSGSSSDFDCDRFVERMQMRKLSGDVPNFRPRTGKDRQASGTNLFFRDYSAHRYPHQQHQQQTRRKHSNPSRTTTAPPATSSATRTAMTLAEPSSVDRLVRPSLNLKRQHSDPAAIAARGGSAYANAVLGEILLSITINPTSKELKVTVYEMKHLTKNGKDSFASFVRVSLTSDSSKSAKRRTKAAKNSSFPKFNETISALKISKEAINDELLKIQVFEDVTSTLVCEVFIPLDKALRIYPEKLSGWFQLQPPQHQQGAAVPQKKLRSASKWPKKTEFADAAGAVVSFLNDEFTLKVPTEDEVEIDELVTAYKNAHFEDIVPELKDCSKAQGKLCRAVWELFTSELAHLTTLSVLNSHFMHMLDAVSSNKADARVRYALNHCKTSKIFENIDTLLHVSLDFVKELKRTLVDEAENIRLRKLSSGAKHRHGEKEKASQIIRSCLRLQPIMAAFATMIQKLIGPEMEYRSNHERVRRYVKRRQSDPCSLFSTVITWCQQDPRCQRQNFVDLLTQPLQRITRYPLLLKAIEKQISDNSNDTDGDGAEVRSNDGNDKGNAGGKRQHPHQEERAAFSELVRELEEMLMQHDLQIRILEKQTKLRKIENALIWPSAAETSSNMFVSPVHSHLLNTRNAVNLASQFHRLDDFLGMLDAPREFVCDSWFVTISSDGKESDPICFVLVGNLLIVAKAAATPGHRRSMTASNSAKTSRMNLYDNLPMHSGNNATGTGNGTTPSGNGDTFRLLSANSDEISDDSDDEAADEEEGLMVVDMMHLSAIALFDIEDQTAIVKNCFSVAKLNHFCFPEQIFTVKAATKEEKAKWTMNLTTGIEACEQARFSNAFCTLPPPSQAAVGMRASLSEGVPNPDTSVGADFSSYHSMDLMNGALSGHHPASAVLPSFDRRYSSQHSSSSTHSMSHTSGAYGTRPASSPSSLPSAGMRRLSGAPTFANSSSNSNSSQGSSGYQRRLRHHPSSPASLSIPFGEDGHCFEGDSSCTANTSPYHSNRTSQHHQCYASPSGPLSAPPPCLRDDNKDGENVFRFSPMLQPTNQSNSNPSLVSATAATFEHIFSNGTANLPQHHDNQARRKSPAHAHAPVSPSSAPGHACRHSMSHHGDMPLASVCQAPAPSSPHFHHTRKQSTRKGRVQQMASLLEMTHTTTDVVAPTDAVRASSKHHLMRPSHHNVPEALLEQDEYDTGNQASTHAAKPSGPTAEKVTHHVDHSAVKDALPSTSSPSTLNQRDAHVDEDEELASMNPLDLSHDDECDSATLATPDRNGDDDDVEEKASRLRRGKSPTSVGGRIGSSLKRLYARARSSSRSPKPDARVLKQSHGGDGTDSACRNHDNVKLASLSSSTSSLSPSPSPSPSRLDSATAAHTFQRGKERQRSKLSKQQTRSSSVKDSHRVEVACHHDDADMQPRTDPKILPPRTQSADSICVPRPAMGVGKDRRSQLASTHADGANRTRANSDQVRYAPKQGSKIGDGMHASNGMSDDVTRIMGEISTLKASSSAGQLVLPRRSSQVFGEVDSADGDSEGVRDTKSRRSSSQNQRISKVDAAKRLSSALEEASIDFMSSRDVEDTARHGETAMHRRKSSQDALVDSARSSIDTTLLAQDPGLLMLKRGNNVYARASITGEERARLHSESVSSKDFFADNAAVQVTVGSALKTQVDACDANHAPQAATSSGQQLRSELQGPEQRKEGGVEVVPLRRDTQVPPSTGGKRIGHLLSRYRDRLSTAVVPPSSKPMLVLDACDGEDTHTTHTKTDDDDDEDGSDDLGLDVDGDEGHEDVFAGDDCNDSGGAASDDDSDCDGGQPGEYLNISEELLDATVIDDITTNDRAHVNRPVASNKALRNITQGEARAARPSVGAVFPGMKQPSSGPSHSAEASCSHQQTGMPVKHKTRPMSMLVMQTYRPTSREAEEGEEVEESTSDTQLQAAGHKQHGRSHRPLQGSKAVSTSRTTVITAPNTYRRNRGLRHYGQHRPVSTTVQKRHVSKLLDLPSSPIEEVVAETRDAREALVVDATSMCSSINSSTNSATKLSDSIPRLPTNATGVARKHTPPSALTSTSRAVPVTTKRRQPAHRQQKKMLEGSASPTDGTLV